MTQEITLQTGLTSPVLAQVLGGESTSAPSSPIVGDNATQNGQPPAGGGSNIFFFLIIMTVGMFLIMSMSGRKEKKRRAAMLSTIAKRDKVRTAGGIIGTIIEIKDDEVLIETDRSSHTRLLLARGSISQVLDSSKRAKEESKSASPANAETESVSS